MNTALIAVDVQRDFIDGSLGGEGRDGVIEPLKKLARKVDFVIFTRDWHPPNHCSFSDDPQFVDGSWPPHCIQHTDGAAIDGDLFAHVLRHTRRFQILDKGQDEDREEYSGFWATSLSGLIMPQILLDHEINEVIVGGLCTDYCVKETALDLVRSRRFEVSVEPRACAGVAKSTSINAINQMAAEGVCLGG